MVHHKPLTETRIKLKRTRGIVRKPITFVALYLYRYKSKVRIVLKICSQTFGVSGNDWLGLKLQIADAYAIYWSHLPMNKYLSKCSSTTATAAL